MILLKKKFGDTIYQKVFSLIVLSGIFFITLFLAVYYYTVKQEQDVYNKTSAQFKNEVTSLIELNDHTNVSNIVDMVYWDEFQNYLITKSNDWFSQNIIMSLETYDADYLGIYNIEGEFISKHSNDKIHGIDFIPKPVFKKLNDNQLIKFYMKVPEGVVEIYGATIHPSNDVNTRVTKPSGYFFIVRLYDREHFTRLQRISNSTISLTSLNHFATDNYINTAKDLPGWHGKPIGQLYFSRPFDVSFDTTQYILYILMISYLINIAIQLVYSRKWVYKPLKLITNILEKVNENDMRTLKRLPGEFKYISYMFSERHQHNRLLEKAKARAEESDKLKSSFLTNISHEIRTPINAIVGFSDLSIQAGCSDAERREYARIVKQSGVNLVLIIDDLIEMSKIDTNQVVPNFDGVDIDSCMEDLYTTIQITMPAEKDIALRLIPSTGPKLPKILTDGVKLRQILTNLITNSIKYTERGFVAFGCKQTDRGELEFTVQDSGIGIDKNQHRRIFDRFHRVENDFTIKAGGLGLGLTISKAYVQMLGGEISLESNVTGGTTFRFTIPIRSASDDDLTPVIAINENDDQIALTILVAEDNNINFLLMQKMLSMCSHTILRAHDGLEAVQICADNPAVDLVLMDIKMPELDGYEAHSRIRLFRTDLPVIAQTAYASAEDEKKIMDAGFRGYISKPINKEKLIEMVGEVTKFKRAQLC